MPTPTVAHTSKLFPNKLRRAAPSQAQVNAMVESIKTHGGILEPITVRSVNGGYEIVNGEVRWLAASQMKIDIVPIRVAQIDESESAAASLILNMERETVAPEETIYSLEQLVAEFGHNAADTVMENLQSIRLAVDGSVELQDRLRALVSNCGIDEDV